MESDDILVNVDQQSPHMGLMLEETFVLQKKWNLVPNGFVSIHYILGDRVSRLQDLETLAAVKTRIEV